MEITQTQKILLGVLSHALTGTEYAPPVDTDWSALFAESKAQAVAPLVFSSISQYCTDAEAFQEWKAVTIRSLQKNRIIQFEHGQLHQLLTEHGIPYTIIKGCASARDYPDPLLRAMGDVDFLIPDAHWEQTRELLVRQGFTVSGEDHDFHMAFHKNKFSMEMHHEPFGLKGKGTAALQGLVPELVDKSVLVDCDGVVFRMPDPFGHGTVLLLHAYRHLIDTGIGVRHLCDWATFISRFTESQFVEIFQERFEALGIWKLAQIFSATASRYLSIPYQTWMGENDEQTCQMLMVDIFDGGNFGSGKGERTTQNASLYEQEKQLASANSTIQMLRGLNKTAITRYPRLMSIAILRPFGWLILGIRYIFRVATGRRRKAPSNTMQMVNLRKKLYQEFAAFEIE